jgi:hypothetical protein
VPGLGFEVAGHVSWCDSRGAVAFGAWKPSSAPRASPWATDAGQVVMATGQVRWRGQAWLPEDEWARQLATAMQRAELRDVVQRLHGVFSLVRVITGGDVAVVTDPLGMRCVYYGETNDVVAVSSKAALVAEALADEGQPPARDATSSCWLAFSTYRVGTATGFTGVRVLPAGASFEMAPFSTPVVAQSTPWLPDEKLQDAGLDELVELVRDDIADTLRATLERPVDRHVIRLTGGKDSRLLLAVALWAGLAKEYHYETIGPPDLADVQVASRLAETFDLRHEVKFVGLASPRPYPDRVRGFVHATGGMLNMWDLSDPKVPANELCVVGLCSDTMRSFTRARSAMSSDDLVRHFTTQRFGRLDLLDPPVARDLHQLAIDDLLDDPSGRAGPLDLLDAYFLRNRLRFSRMGPQEELAGQRRVIPLYSIDALRAGFTLGGVARQRELLHFEIMRRCSEELVAHPFAGPGWDVTLAARVPSDAGQVLTRRALQATTEAATTKHPSLMQSLQASGFDERKEFFHDVLQDRRNPIWELIRRDTLEAALQRFESLTTPERRELYGALTAALWLGAPPI